MTVENGTGRCSPWQWAALAVDRSAPRARTVGWITLVVIALLVPQLVDAQAVQIATLIAFTWAGAAPLNLVSGNAGLFSLGYIGLLAIGGFVAGVAAQNYELSWPICLLAATAAGLVAGVIVALPTLRWRGMYVILGTLALHFIAIFAVLRFGEMLDRPTGFTFPIMTIFGREILSDTSLYYLMLTVALLSVYVCVTLAGSHIGRGWVAARENRIVSEAVGVNVGRGSITAFAVSSALIGLLGGVYGYFIGVFSFESLSLSTALEYVAIILLGGLGSPIGALLGSAFYVGLPYLISWAIGLLPMSLQDDIVTKQPYIEVGAFGVVIAAVVLLEPRGLVHIASRLGTAALVVLRSRAQGLPPRSTTATPHAAKTRVDRELLTPAVADGSLLSIQDLTVGYGISGPVLHGVSLSLGPGDVLGIVGANGAGKTTLAGAIGGFGRAESASIVRGTISWKGKSVEGSSPSKMAALGIISVPETDKIFPSLTVKEHFDLVRPASGRRFEMDEIVDLFPALQERWSRPAGYLSGGERQMLAVARALRQGPELLILDELSLGLAPVVVVDLVVALERLCELGGLTLIIVEQAVEIVSRLASDVIVLDRGELVGRGSPNDLEAAGVFESAYLGVENGAST